MLTVTPRTQGLVTVAPGQPLFTQAPQAAGRFWSMGTQMIATGAPVVSYAAPQAQQVVFAGGPAPISAAGMAKLKEFTTDHHWRKRAKLMEPMFEKAGNGAKSLDYQQCQQFYKLVGQELLGEPLDHLLTPDIFERFEYKGDGRLDFIHAFKSFKGTLYEIFHVQGGETIKPIDFATPEQKGYTIIKELARGGQGAAILAKNDKYGEIVLKTYEKSNPNSGSIEEHIAEMEVLRELKNEGNIMHAYDIFQDAKCVYCVNELMSGGDLEALREKAGAANVALTSDYFKKIFAQCLKGLEHIHEHGLMHCDIKEPNIMMKDKNIQAPNCAIIDFGLAHVCAGPGEAGGTPGYIPPETNSRHIWYPKGDMFALGVTFFQLLADKTPQEKLAKFGVFQEGFRTLEDVVLFTATRPLPVHLISQTFPDYVPWVSQMCSKEKKPRPRTRQLLDLPFFADLKGDDEEAEEGSDWEEEGNDKGCTGDCVVQ